MKFRKIKGWNNSVVLTVPEALDLSYYIDRSYHEEGTCSSECGVMALIRQLGQCGYVPKGDNESKLPNPSDVPYPWPDD